MKNKVIVFDLDGTLLDANNEIIGGAQTLDCLSLLKNMGCTLAICTGRLDHDIIKINEKYKLNISHRISQNGAVLTKDAQFEGILLDKSEAKAIYQHIKKEKIRIELNTVSNRYFQEERDPSFPKELYDSHIIRNNYDEIIVCQPVVLFLLVGETQKLQEIQTFVNENYKLTKAVMTSQTSLEILSKNASKGKAIKKLYNGYDVYAIGDSPNDFDMFPVVKQGYLVSSIDCPYDCIQSENISIALKDVIDKISKEEGNN